ncbi:MAG TPA: hypothetical protein VFH93_04815 [Thermoleophilia bacterium]|nr:hypothetical protein [Thermoleophilia bacterium]
MQRLARPLDIIHEAAMLDLATLTARWSADLRVAMRDRLWHVSVIDRRGSVVAADYAGTFTDAVRRCLAELQRVTDEDDAREAAGEVSR